MPPPTPPIEAIASRRVELTRHRADLLAERPGLALDGLADPAAAERLAALTGDLADLDRQLALLDDAEAEAARRDRVEREERKAAERTRLLDHLDAALLGLDGELDASEVAVEQVAAVLIRLAAVARAVDQARIQVGKPPLAQNAVRMRVIERLCGLLNALYPGFAIPGSVRPLGAGDVPR